MVDRYRVIIGNQAFEDIEQIHDFISQSSEQNAGLMVARLLDAIDDLSILPHRFRVSGRSKRHSVNIQSRVVSPYLIYYFVSDSDKLVTVTDIIHGARKQPTTFD